MSAPTAPMVIALGGNAISPPGEEGNISQQFSQTRQTVCTLADLIDTGRSMVITHGNGPQVGNAIRRVELSLHEVYPLDLGICVADLQGGMGYMIAQCLANEFIRRGHERHVFTVLTSVEVDPSDPAFENPTKPIGSYYNREDADHFRTRHGWNMVEIPDQGFRRVVPSPQPHAIVEIELIRRLAEAGEILIAGGGGGIPVYRTADGTLEGCEVVIDKDLASGLMAREIGAKDLVILTAVEQVCLDWGKPTQRPLAHLNVTDARQHLEAGQFPAGSMGPKMRAAVEFLEGSPLDDARVVICSLDHMADALAGRAGTTVTRN